MSLPDRAPTRTSAFGWLVAVVTPVLMLTLVVADEIQVLRSMGRHPRPDVIAVFGLVFLLALFGSIVVHELGHLAVALLLRLPVKRVRLLPGRRSSGIPAHVRVMPHPDGVALPLRMVLMMLAGPAANLVVAGLFWRSARGAEVGPERHGLLLLPAITDALLGFSNLIPVSVRGHGSDGMKAIAWLTRPTQKRKAPAVNRGHRGANWYADYVAELRRGGIPDLAELRAIVDGPDVPAALAAAVLLMNASARAGREEFLVDVPRLSRAARNPRLRADVAATIGGAVAWQQNLELLNAAYKSRSTPDPKQLSEIAALAEYAHGRQRSNVRARCALAVTRCIQERADEARNLLVGADADTDSADERTDVFAVRALAELQLGDLAQSRRLMRAATRTGGTSRLLALAELGLKHEEALLAGGKAAADHDVAEA